ncbi:MAG: hypothetical protein ACOC9N_00050 [Gemmatimonadota bacterium]
MGETETGTDRRTEHEATVEPIEAQPGAEAVDRTYARALRRVALYLECPPSVVESNVPAALEKVLCSLPWETRLRRRRDRVVLADARLLWEALPPDDMRRKRVQFLLEHAERRARL